MKSYKFKKPVPTSIRTNKSYQGESIEHKVFRITTNKEPIKDSAPIVYTERKDGVKPEYNIRTDRAELMVEATDKIARAKLSKREERLNPKETHPEPRTEVIPRPNQIETPGATPAGEGGA